MLYPYTWLSIFPVVLIWETVSRFLPTARYRSEKMYYWQQKLYVHISIWRTIFQKFIMLHLYLTASTWGQYSLIQSSNPPSVAKSFIGINVYITKIKNRKHIFYRENITFFVVIWTQVCNFVVSWPWTSYLTSCLNFPNHKMEKMTTPWLNMCVLNKLNKIQIIWA